MEAPQIRTQAIITRRGGYDVQLTVTNDTGCVVDIYQEVYVYLEPIPWVMYNAPCEDSLMTFNDGTVLDSGSVVSWNWDVAGFVNGTDSTISYTFSDPGSYIITLSVVTDKGCEGITTQGIVVDSCFVIGTELLEDLSTFPYSINPNPNQGIFHIGALNQAISPDLRLDVYGITGASVLQISGSELIEDHLNIDLRQFGKGLYFLRILEGQNAYSTKVVVH